MSLVRLNFQDLEKRSAVLGPGMVRSSEEFGWKSIYFEHRQGSDSYETVEHVMDGHYLMVRLNSMSKAERKLDGCVQLETQHRGTTAYVPDNCPHQVRYVGALGNIHLMSVPKETIDQVADEYSIGRFEGVPSFAQAEDRFVLEAAESLDRELMHGNPHGDLFAQTYAKVLASHIVTRYGTPQKRNVKLSALSPSKLRWLDQYIESMLAHSISLSELATQVGMSEYHFCRVFKTAVGFSPYQYVLRKRIEFACICIEKDHLSIQDIAFATGFSDPCQFAKQFKRITGLTPSAYRTNRVAQSRRASMFAAVA